MRGSYAYPKKGFDGLLPAERGDKGSTRALSADLQELSLDMKREEPGRSVPLIIREFENARRVARGEAQGLGRSTTTTPQESARDAPRGLESALNPARYRILYLHHATVSSRDLYRQASALLCLEPKAHPSAILCQILAHMEEPSDPRKVHPVLLLDEAQLVPLGMLEQLCILPSFRMDSEAFLRIVLVAQQSLQVAVDVGLCGQPSLIGGAKFQRAARLCAEAPG